MPIFIKISRNRCSKPRSKLINNIVNGYSKFCDSFFNPFSNAFNDLITDALNSIDYYWCYFIYCSTKLRYFVFCDFTKPVDKAWHISFNNIKNCHKSDNCDCCNTQCFSNFPQYFGNLSSIDSNVYTI